MVENPQHMRRRDRICFYSTKEGVIIVACGTNFPDGFCSGALSYTKKAPIILPDSGCESFAEGYVTDYDIQTSCDIGSAKVVSDNSVRKAFNLTAEDIIN